MKFIIFMILLYRFKYITYTDKIFLVISHIEGFPERRNKSKAKKIKQVLTSPNLSEDVQSYL